MWYRNSFDSICSKRRRMVEPPPSVNLWSNYLLYWYFVEEMFRKLSWTPNLSRYWTGCIWHGWSNMHSCKCYKTLQLSWYIIRMNITSPILFFIWKKKDKRYLFSSQFSLNAGSLVHGTLCKCRFVPFPLFMSSKWHLFFCFYQKVIDVFLWN